MGWAPRALCRINEAGLGTGHLLPHCMVLLPALPLGAVDHPVSIAIQIVEGGSCGGLLCSRIPVCIDPLKVRRALILNRFSWGRLTHR